MKQLELPFTVRARRVLRRVKGVNRRAWKCWHKEKPRKFEVIQACDAAEARSLYLRKLVMLADVKSDPITAMRPKFLDVVARRHPEGDLK